MQCNAMHVCSVKDDVYAVLQLRLPGPRRDSRRKRDVGKNATVEDMELVGGFNDCLLPILPDERQ